MSSSSKSTGPDFTDVFLASMITGTTVMVMHGVLEGVMGFGGLGAGSPFLRLVVNLIVSAASGFIAISLVNATGLLDPTKN